MTNQLQPLTLKLSNGKEISVPAGKSVLQFTENGQPRSCAVVRGPEGVAVYNAAGDVLINGAGSSAHWLQAGDEIRFSESLTASVEQLGTVSQSLDSLIKEDTPSANTQPTDPTTAAPVAAAQDTFTPATAANSFVPEAPAPVEAPAPIETPAPVAAVQDTFTPATAANSFVPEAPAMDFVAPAVTAAALAASVLPATSILRGESTPANEPQLEPTESAGSNPLSSILDATAAPAPAEATTSEPEISDFAADLLARIQADNNDNEAVGTTTSETTHSPLAADGSSLSSPEPIADADSSISSLIPELPPTSVPAPVAETIPEIETAANIVETSTAESAERQEQSTSASALLERMKSEGQWEGMTEEEEEQPPEPEAPAFADADEDVQSYMSQLLSRMRDPNAEPKAATVAPAAPKPAKQDLVREVVDSPKTIGLLKPEEFVPKTKAKRLDSLQDMRALANTQTRTAIDRSQAKRKEAVKDSFTIAIAVASCLAAAFVFFFNIFGALSFAGGVIAMICGAFFGYKTHFSKTNDSDNNHQNVAPQSQEVAQEHV